MSFVRSLHLTAFRNYPEASLVDMHDGFIIITGDNGAGKTNILEAISLLSPGRGLRGAKGADFKCANMGVDAMWGVAAHIETPYGAMKIGTGAQGGTDRRLVRINGVDAKAQTALAEYVSCVWLTPQMDGLFLGSATDRRRFFDRLVYAFDPSHAGRVTRYDHALSQRAKLLKGQRETGVRADGRWLSSLELSMAQTGVAIAAARLSALDSLSANAEGILQGTGFPVPDMQLSGGVEDALRNRPALEVEEWFRAALEEARGHDVLTGGASVGPHRTDLQVTYAAKGVAAALCSTGEQKALLTAIVLAHAVRTRDVRDMPPILLLDEVAAHFDATRRASLFDVLGGIGAQVFITGTDYEVFSGVPNGRHIRLGRDAQILGVAA